MIETLIKLMVIILLILVNGFFVACEFAIVKIRPSRIDSLINEGNKKAKKCKIAIENINSCLSATQLGITLCSLALGWMGEPVLVSMLMSILDSMHLNISTTIIHIGATIVAFICITGLEVVIGEQVPKSLALYNTEAIILGVAPILLFFCKIMRPGIFVCNKSTDLCLKPFGYSQTDEINEPHTDDEIRMLVEESYKNGLIDSTEQILVDNVFDFTDTTAREIMVPRTDMECIYKTDSNEKIFSVLTEGCFTRYPICDKDKDDILGFVHIRDLFNQKIKNEKIELEAIIRPIIFVSESTQINNLFENFKRDKSQIAIVVDEYGGTSGLVTIEDIIEEIVGEIQDEFDKEQPYIKQIDEYNYLVSGNSPVDMINEKFETDIDCEEFDSIGGWIYAQLGTELKEGAMIENGCYMFSVTKLLKQRVMNVTITQKENDIHSEESIIEREQNII